MSLSMKVAEQELEAGRAPRKLSVMISVVVPVTERWDDLDELYRKHAAVLSRTRRPFEFIFVVDAGCEGAIQTLQPLQISGEPIRVLTLPRRFGEATALMVGFAQAQGEVLITLSSYFQVMPEGIEKLLTAIEGGCDLAIARRFPRTDSWINRAQTYGFHFLTSWLTGVRLQDISCGVKAIHRRVIREIDLYGDLHRFLPLLAYQRGFRVEEISVPQHPRDARIRVYSPGVYVRRLLDILTLVFLFKFTKKPLRFFGLIGAGLFGTGLLISGFLAVQRLWGLTALADRPVLILGVLLMVLGVQTASIGLLGEMIVFTHARKMRDYAIEKILG